MDEPRKNEFRRILYAAMLDFLTHTPISPYCRRILNPWRGWKAARRLTEIQLLADWLHNLAQFAANDFKAFDESRVWREWKTLVCRFPQLARHPSLMRFQFEQDWNPVTENHEKYASGEGFRNPPRIRDPSIPAPAPLENRTPRRGRVAAVLRGAPPRLFAQR